jgi:hypothetical protein
VSWIRSKTYPGKHGSRTYFFEVESRYDPKLRRSRERVLRYLGKSPIHPLDPIPLPKTHLALLATHLAAGDLTAADLLAILRGMGVEIPRTALAALAIRYDLGEKTLELHLFPRGGPDPLHPARRAGRRPSSAAPTRPASARSRVRDD